MPFLLPTQTGLRRAAGAVLNLLLPPCCPCCDTLVASQGELCAACFAATGFITEPLCQRCGVPFRYGREGGEARLCVSCATGEGAFHQARAALRYDAQAKKLILPLKHADRPEIARVLAPMMARAGAALLAEAELLVPVPLHRKRLRQRRYNQAALLTIALAQRGGHEYELAALRRTRPTKPLGELGAAARQQEVADAFAFNPSVQHRIAGRRLLLIDDVMTSGATANACAAILRQAGAARVDVLAAARVPDPRYA